ncbi:MAG: metal ABC transporter permease [Planctomycetota bacterium]
MTLSDFTWQLDGWIICAGVLCAISAAMLGSFLVLRRMSLLGDAISHAVLPGLAAAFLFSGSRSSGMMFIGAVVIGVLTALLTDFIHRRGTVDEGAAMGVVFTTLFATGLVMIVVAADRVELDPDCVLYGAIERTPLDQVTLSLPGGIAWQMPRVVWMLAGVLLLNLIFTVVFFKELKLSTFDPALGDAIGFSSTWMHYALMTLVAITAVASFESVGNILVVAMFVVPPAAASLLTNRLASLIVLACLMGAVAAITGHIAAVSIPKWFGFDSTTTAGMMAVMAGLLFAMALLLAPRNGLLPRLARRWWLSWTILSDDVLSLLYRIEERPNQRRFIHPNEARDGESDSIDWIADMLLTTRRATQCALRWHAFRGKVVAETPGQLPALTAVGRSEATSLVRSHRLWEQYLMTQGDASDNQVHGTAHRLEHFTDSKLQAELNQQTDSPNVDPHGSEIPQ